MMPVAQPMVQAYPQAAPMVLQVYLPSSRPDGAGACRPTPNQAAPMDGGAGLRTFLDSAPASPPAYISAGRVLRKARAWCS